MIFSVKLIRTYHKTSKTKLNNNIWMGSRKHLKSASLNVEKKTTGLRSLSVKTISKLQFYQFEKKKNWLNWKQILHFCRQHFFKKNLSSPFGLTWMTNILSFPTKHLIFYYRSRALCWWRGPFRHIRSLKISTEIDYLWVQTYRFINQLWSQISKNLSASKQVQGSH